VAEYLVAALRQRQRATAHYAFSRVRPLDEVSVSGSILCFEDLVIRHGLTSPEAAANTRYFITTFDRRGRELRRGRSYTATAATGRVCTKPLALAATNDRYTVVRVQTTGAAGRTFVHLARDPASSELRVIGIWRQ
jgi:hypothetical protein